MIKPNKRRFVIGIYVLSGWLPWGRNLDAGNPKRAGSDTARVSVNYWPICCGHVLRDTEVQAWKAAGLLVAGEPLRGLETVRAGPKLEMWINDAWHDMQVRSWSQ